MKLATNRHLVGGGELPPPFAFMTLWLIRHSKKFIIIIMLVITFMQCTYSDIPDTNRVPTVHSVAAVLYLQFMVPTCNVISHVKHVLYFYVSTSRSKWAVPNIAVFCSSSIPYFPGLLSRYSLSDCEMAPAAPTITGITFTFTVPRAVFLL